MEVEGLDRVAHLDFQEDQDLQAAKDYLDCKVTKETGEMQAYLEEEDLMVIQVHQVILVAQEIQVHQDNQDYLD